ncbi:unnamed protein product [Urochloa humidicola]
MLGLPDIMKWWEEWQLRILVLGSQFIQFILLLAQLLRRTRCRSFIWLAYIGGDALAIYALTTLFSRQKLHKSDEGVKISSLEVVWVPVLLIHLGGQYTISAYSLEDNELWRRHVITLVTQVTVAMYSFYKWWFGDVKLLVAAISLFILGIIKFAEKPWALRSASFNSLQASSALSTRRKQGAVAAWWTWCTSIPMEYDKALKNRRQQDECESLQEYVQKASKIVQEEVEKEKKAGQDIEARQAVQDIEEDNNQEERSDEDRINSPIVQAASNAVQGPEAADNQEKGSDEDWAGFGHTNYFVDVIAPYSVRLRELQTFMKLGHLQRTDKVKWYLAAKSTIMYTHVRTAGSPLGQVLHLILFPCLAIASLLLFAFSRKDGYNMNDIRVTYILFSCTALLEFYAHLLYMLGTFVGKFLRFRTLSTMTMSGWVFQYNLLSYYARKKQPTFLMKLAIFNFLRELVNKTWYIWKVRSGRDINGRAFRHVVRGWTKFIRGDAGRYKRFNNLRGQLVLRKNGQMEKIGWSVRTHFDESVLLWHIATDLCFHNPNRSPQSTQASTATTQLREPAEPLLAPLINKENTEFLPPPLVSRAISNYMIYLLLNQPEMLIPGARSALFSNAGDYIESLLKNSDAALDGEEKSIAKAIIIQAKKTEDGLATETEALLSKTEDTLVFRACKLTEALMELGEERMWLVIQGVWTEMLCYSVSRRRGYLQAKYMAERRDCLDFVWVFWAFMGMETWVERYHRLEFYSKEDEAAEGAGAAGPEGVRGGQVGYYVGESSSGHTRE